MRNTIYLETGSADPYYNLAFEEFILCNRPEGIISCCGRTTTR